MVRSGSLPVFVKRNTVKAMTGQSPILVTGGAGFIGSHLCKLLARTGRMPVVYDNLVRGYSDAVRWGPLEIGDLADQDRLTEVMRRYRPEAVIHLAGLIAVGESVADPGPYYAANVSASISLFEAMRATGVEKIVFSSSAAVYGLPETMPILETAATAPINPYGFSKMVIEQVLADYGRAYGLRWMALRYFNAAGADPEGELGERHDPETHLIPLVLDVAAGKLPAVSLYGNDYPTPDGTCIRDYIHVWDLAQAHLNALEYLGGGGESQALNLGTGKGASVAEIISTAERVTGRSIPVTIRSRRAGDPPCLVADPTKAMSLLRWKPAFPDVVSSIQNAWAFRHPDMAVRGR